MKLVKILDKLTPEIAGSIQVGLPENKEFNFVIDDRKSPTPHVETQLFVAHILVPST